MMSYSSPEYTQETYTLQKAEARPARSEMQAGIGDFPFGTDRDLHCEVYLKDYSYEQLQERVSCQRNKGKERTHARTHSHLKNIKETDANTIIYFL